MRKSVVRAITFVAGLFFLLEFLLPAGEGRKPGGPAATQPAAVAAPGGAATAPATAPVRAAAPAEVGAAAKPKKKGNFLTPLLPDVTNFAIVVGAMAFLLGPINLVRNHLATLLRRGKGRVESCAFLACLVLGITVKSFEGSELGARLGMDILHDALSFGVATAFFASSMALLAFYLVSAAHRALRLNNLEAGLMLVAATIVLLGQVPVGDWLTSGLPGWLQFRSWTQWLLTYPNGGVQRAVLIGASGGAIAASLRHWLGLGTRTE
ncbi:MAG TPA: hypothetical protein VM695_10860 [Phycisphaerae bacterium]|nr:hypothetical protein [Phycisphaerae bacterium]